MKFTKDRDRIIINIIRILCRLAKFYVKQYFSGITVLKISHPESKYVTSISYLKLDNQFDLMFNHS